ncbi:MAG: hypothetical protein [Wendovervirus sonii]|uniref:Uncharacterized protein n=1 Tax=phage Lak_Megaphage_Sonny TaxID=3109229 RepID=A0ABZ0Z2M5_9CAUD|nr:MAG: hypothetical protein [phage Lak_Megaphage_Sonny]
MKTLNIDFYHQYENTYHAEIQFPDDTIFCKVGWSKFGRVLDHLERTKTKYDEDDYCYDVYCYIPEQDEDYFDNIENVYVSLCIDCIKFDKGILVRMHNCDIIDFNNYLTLEEFNKQLNFSDAYYVQVKNTEIPDDFLKSDLNISAVIEKIKKLEKERVISYLKVIKLVDQGLYVKSVNVTSWLSEQSDDSIDHDVFKISNFETNEYDKIRIIHKGISIKDAYEKRIQEIINI